MPRKNLLNNQRHAWELASTAGDNPEVHVCSKCGVIRKKFSARALVKHKKPPTPTYRYHKGDSVIYILPHCKTI